MNYETLVPLSPPRPEKTVPDGTLGFYERMGWIGQYKMNGTYSVIYVSPDKEVTALTRHLEPHKMWTPTTENMAPFAALPGNGWNVICCELLHSKVTDGPKNTHFIHDVLVKDGEWLLGKTYAQRYQMLQSMFLKDPISDCESHWEMAGNIWLAKNLKKGFKKTFASIADSKLVEGLVMKDPRSVLTSNGTERFVKCRKPTKNYQF